MIGYLLEQELDNALGRPPGRHAAHPGGSSTSTTPPSRDPTKPIGPVYDETTAERLAAERGWTVASRRTALAPRRRHRRSRARSSSCETIRAARRRGRARGLRRRRRHPGRPRAPRHGSAASRRSSTRTSPPRCSRSRCAPTRCCCSPTSLGVEVGWGTPSARPLDATTPAELRRLEFAAGSMGPKVEAAARFVEATGGRAVIGALKHAASLMAGSEGTKVTPSRSLVARST